MKIEDVVLLNEFIDSEDDHEILMLFMYLWTTFRKFRVVVRVFLKAYLIKVNIDE